MSAPANSAALAHDPDPHQDQAQADSPARVFRLRRALSILIVHGRQLAETLIRRPASGSAFWIGVRFGTRDIAWMLARITRALQMAAALQAILPQEQPAQPARRPPAARKPGTRAAPPAPKRDNRALAILPPSKEIAAYIRQHSVGDILTEICLGLGILTVESFWQDVEAVLIEQGGDCGRIKQDADKRTSTSSDFLSEMGSFPPDPPPPPAPQIADSAPAATGPP